MAFENLFIRTQRSIAGIKLDAVLSERHQNTATKTKNPVEYGAEVNDHVTIEPVVVDIVAEVSDTPLGAAAFGELLNPSNNEFGAATENQNEYITRSQSAYRKLIEIRDKREPIEIQTKLRNYKNMVILNISTQQDVNSSRSVTLNITAEELELVPSETVEISQDVLEQGETQQQAASESDQGRQVDIVPAEEITKSVLKQFFDFLGITTEGGGL